MSDDVEGQGPTGVGEEQLTLLDQWAEFLGLGELDDSLAEMLRAQMVLESALTHVLEQRLPRYNAIEWGNYDFSLAVQVAEASNFITPELSRSLKFIGRLRNKFAHDFRRQPRGDEGRNLFGLLPQNCKAFVDAEISSLDQSVGNINIYGEDFARLLLGFMALLRELESLIVRGGK
jgi:hypothetical protein